MTEITKPSTNTYIRATSEGYLYQQAEVQQHFASREQAMAADEVRAAWEGLKAGIVAVRTKRFVAESHDLTAQCRVFSGAVALQDSEARLSIFTELDGDGNAVKTMAVQVTLAKEPGTAVIDFWSGHPRETRLVDQALAGGALFTNPSAKLPA